MNSDLFRSIFSSNYAAREHNECVTNERIFCNAAPEHNERVAKERIFSYY